MTAQSDHQRDTQLAALLKATVDAPPLRPDFHDELETRLIAAAAGRAARVTSIPARRRLTTRRLLVAAAVAAAAAVFAFAVLPALRGADTATAGDVLAAMTATSGGAQSVRLHMIATTTEAMSRGAAPIEVAVDTADVTMSIRGDVLLDMTSTWRWRKGDGSWMNLASASTYGYDQAHHEARSIPRSIPRGRSAPYNPTIRRPAWQLDTNAGFQELYTAVAAQMHAALAEEDPSMPVQETSYLGRPAWRCVFTVHERWWAGDGKVAMAFHWDAAVDQATGLLLAASYTTDVRGTRRPFKWELRVTSLQLDPPLHPGWQRPGVGGSKVTMVDEGTRFGTPEQVAGRSWPTLPLIPQWAPAGYRLTDTASAGFAPNGGYPPTQWSPHQGRAQMVGKNSDATLWRVEWPIDGQTVLVRFRRGFSSFTVQITPKSLGAGIHRTPDVTLSAGYLKGQPALFGADSREGTQTGISVPTLITYSDRSRIVITGDLTRQELVAVANSMRVYGDENRPLTPGFGNQ
jgi:hypothetical protein